MHCHNDQAYRKLSPEEWVEATYKKALNHE